MNKYCKGQGLLETIIALPAVVLALLIICKIAYRQIVFLAMDYHIHEALICTHTKTLKKCEEEVSTRMKPFLLNKEKVTVHLREDLVFFYARSELNLEPLMTIEKKLRKRLL